ncbi:hypothetical protein [Candidatus Uabimicrobium sp. HlEnr_7]|uniref:hypothetical protein n=1 Tax=Candidatus Uabimicrobium helgolandensis TaxID=3095367 RepID=UPI0035571443
MRKLILWLPFLGFIISFAICFSYISYFVFNERIRDNPLIIIITSFIVGLIATYGAISTIHKSSKKILKIANFIFALLALIFPLIFTFFTTTLSYDLPDQNLALQGDVVAPVFTLIDSNEHKVSLQDFSGKNLLVVFYRGHW